MAVIRVNKTSNYTIMSNYHFKEKKMSLKAKGLLSMMLSLPDDWDYSIAGLATLSKDGKDSVMSALKELEQFGYLTRTKIINEKGHFKGYDYDIFEMPQILPPNSENPNADDPKEAEPKTGKTCQLKTNQLTTNESKTNDQDKQDKRQIIAPNAFSKELIKNGYIEEDDIQMDQYNEFLQTKANEHGLDALRSCLWYFIKQTRTREIENKFFYMQKAIEQGLQRIAIDYAEKEVPKSLSWLIS